MSYHLAGRRLGLALLAMVALASVAHAQGRLKSMRGHDQFTKMSSLRADAVKSGQIAGTWSDSGNAFDYMWDGKHYRFDAASRTTSEAAGSVADATPPGRRGGAGRERGRQDVEAISPDKMRKAVYRDRNLWLTDAEGGNALAITTDGSEKERVKYGTASWVYGEELNQTSAMWWNPASTKVAYYRFNEKPVPDFLLQMDQTKIQSALDVEAYPKAGVDNPVVDIMVYDVATGRHHDAGHPRRQAVHERRRGSLRLQRPLVAGWPRATRQPHESPSERSGVRGLFTGDGDVSRRHSRGVADGVGREQSNAHVARRQEALSLGSERTGFRNYYLYDVAGQLLHPVTQHRFEVAGIVRVDKAAGMLWYMARDGDNHLKLQLHRVGLDGKGDVRLTDPGYTHFVNLSPDAKLIVDVAQAHDVAPSTRVLDARGKAVLDLVKSDLSKFDQIGLKKVEMFTYLAADGRTTLHGMISFPSTFNPARKYPVLMSVYGGPTSPATTENWTMPSAQTEYGFITVSLDSRAAGGIGKRVLDAIYLKLGQVEMDDMAEGLKALATRPYVDGSRIGIFGT